jgi:hypothetical protein
MASQNIPNISWRSDGVAQSNTVGSYGMTYEPGVSPKTIHNVWPMHRAVYLKLKPVLRIRIRMFLGLLDPDPLVRGTDPDPDPSHFS